MLFLFLYLKINMKELIEKGIVKADVLFLGTTFKDNWLDVYTTKMSYIVKEIHVWVQPDFANAKI